VTGARHLLVIPDGNRRHAKREYLCSLLRESRGSLAAALSSIPDKDASALRRRIETYLQTGDDHGLEKAVDLLDRVSVELPPEFLLTSYRKSGRLIEELLRSCLTDRSLDILTVFGMQTRNLSRVETEVLAFLHVESDYARKWSNDPDLIARCRFQMVGDQAAFDQLETPALRKAARDYAEAAAALQAAGQGDELCVNILAPYDFLWEIERATVDGRFDRNQLAVANDVDLVIRSGSIGRSPTSGALPLQVAFSRLHLISDYFPDCSVRELRKAIDDCAGGRPESGL